jgi:hypothetical protein
MGAGGDQYDAYLPDRMWSLAELYPMIYREMQVSRPLLSHSVTERIMNTPYRHPVTVNLSLCLTK